MLPVLTPSEFVAIANQTLDMAFPVVEITGEVLQYRVSKNRWVYFDIADKNAKLRCFGTVYVLPAPLENGMQVRIVCTPRLHPVFGFSLNLQSLAFSGEGTIKKAADLLAQKLEREGLFAEDRKRPLPYPPSRIGLITSSESAAYKDFIKVLAGRYGGLRIELADVQVQGEAAPAQIVRAIEWFNKQADIADVLVIIRGGGSADDLQAFSDERVVRAVAASRTPTCVAIGHESDMSLAELAADLRASTPSNAAELLVPDRKAELSLLQRQIDGLKVASTGLFEHNEQILRQAYEDLNDASGRAISDRQDTLTHAVRTLQALSPVATMKRGYSIIRKDGKVVRSTKQLEAGAAILLEFADGELPATVE